MKAGRSRDTLQGVDLLNQKVTIEPSPHSHISIASTADFFGGFTSSNAGADDRFDFAGERNRRFQA
jgi:hypothetical protein